MSGGIESQIFDNIESATGESFEDANVGNLNGTETQDDGDVYNLPPRNEARGRERQVDDELANQRHQQDPARREKQQDPLAKPQESKPPQKGQQQKPFRDEKGNLVDEQGRIIARAGQERRLHVQNENLRNVNTNLTKKLQETERSLEKERFLGDIPKRFNLSQDDLAESMAIAAEFKTNPAQAARHVISMAVAAGASLRDIVNDELLPDINLKAVNQLIDKRFGPVLQERQQAQNVEATQQAAYESAQTFLADYPEAEPHQDAIARVMKLVKQEYDDRGREAPSGYHLAEEAFKRVARFAEHNGLDLNEPLGPQIAALESGQQRQTQPVANGRRRMPMPNGSGGGGVSQYSRNSSRPDANNGDIVREAMREHGFNV